MRVFALINSCSVMCSLDWTINRCFQEGTLSLLDYLIMKGEVGDDDLSYLS